MSTPSVAVAMHSLALHTKAAEVACKVTSFACTPSIVHKP